MENFLNTWLNSQLAHRGWTYSELARRADISTGTLSNIMAGRNKPGLDFCIGVARAFDRPPEVVMRIAGLLPPQPPAVDEEDECIDLFRRLSDQARAVVVTTMRSLLGLSVQPAISEKQVEYETPEEREAARLLDELDGLTPDDVDEVFAFMKRLRDRSQRRADAAEDLPAGSD